MNPWRFVLGTCTVLSLACSAEDSGAPASSSGSVTGGEPGAAAPSTGGAAPSVGGASNSGGVEPGAGAPSAGSPSTAPPRSRCAAPAGLGAYPGTIDEAVSWLNALPKPTTAACFLESLPRPLSLVATNSQFSAQPAFSSASPRVFIELGRLWVSAVIDGEASYLLEFGYRPPDSELNSIKGELKLPLDAAIPASAPYEQVRYGSGTTCGFCHRAEEAVTGVPFDAFVSAALKPRPETYVSVASIRAEHERCDWTVNAHRCEMLSAVFDGGEVLESTFPSEMPTFF